jgi:hypothetical protein
VTLVVNDLLNLVIWLALLVAGAIVLRWAAAEFGVPPPIVRAILIVLGVIALVLIVRAFLGLTGVPVLR